MDPFRQLLPLQGPVLVLHLILYTVSCSSTTYTVSCTSTTYSVSCTSTTYTVSCSTPLFLCLVRLKFLCVLFFVSLCPVLRLTFLLCLISLICPVLYLHLTLLCPVLCFFLVLFSGSLFSPSFLCLGFHHSLIFTVSCFSISHVYCGLCPPFSSLLCPPNISKLLCPISPLLAYVLHISCFSIYHIYCVFYFPCSYTVFTVSLHISYLLCLLYPLFLYSI